MPTTEASYKCKKCGALGVDGCADYIRVIGDKEDWAQWEAAGAADVAKYLPPLADKEIAHYQSLKD